MKRREFFTMSAGLLLLAVFIGGGLWLKHAHKAKSIDEPLNVSQGEVKVIVKSVKDNGSYYSIDAEYPQFEGVAPIFNQSIEKVVTDAIADHKQVSEENQKARAQFDAGIQPDAYQLYVKWEQVQVNSSYISFVMRIGGYTGGAHGYENMVTFNYDVKNQKIMTLADMFPNDANYLKTLSDYSRKQLHESLGDYANEEMINSGTEPNEVNFKNFTFTDMAVTVYFTQYQVGPYVVGEQSVIYPKTQ